jgi:phage terminase large subunit GpA-like protein
MVRFSDELPPEYFGGLVSETYNPTKNRFEKRRGGPRNEPLDTWVYAYAATHHPELRLQKATKADWDAREARLMKAAETDVSREARGAGGPGRIPARTDGDADLPATRPPARRRSGWVDSK